MKLGSVKVNDKEMKIVGYAATENNKAQRVHVLNWISHFGNTCTGY